MDGPGGRASIGCRTAVECRSPIDFHPLEDLKPCRRPDPSLAWLELGQRLEELLAAAVGVVSPDPISKRVAIGFVNQLMADQGVALGDRSLRNILWTLINEQGADAERPALTNNSLNRARQFPFRRLRVSLNTTGGSSAPETGDETWEKP